jgi:hypothetical protein
MESVGQEVHRRSGKETALGAHPDLRMLSMREILIEDDQLASNKTFRLLANTIFPSYSTVLWSWVDK